jgi:hypothetical protein
MQIPRIYLEKNPKATLDYPGLQGFPLFSNFGYWPKDRRQIYNLLDYLDVEHSARYQPAAGATHCDCYVGDYCAARGVYLPSVFWNNSVIQNGHPFPEKAILGPVEKGGTVRKLNANALFKWLLDYGTDFGWSEIRNFTALQHLANKNAVCIISAKNRNPGKSGHIVVVIPEWLEKLAIAVRDGRGLVAYPVTSEGGEKCRKISSGDNWFVNPKYLVRLWCNNG